MRSHSPYSSVSHQASEAQLLITVPHCLTAALMPMSSLRAGTEFSVCLVPRVQCPAWNMVYVGGVVSEGLGVGTEWHLITREERWDRAGVISL